eukprot:TRINITY_DN299_c0_g2_i6.p1 TRINITY_DN299_c0_g2~~TRINITY_DN299_c0_g2_i6.p1  ORF type:complete len:566 (+),score=40.63 TRINITY_DN299_c0_g2_i6:160-1857(+)
MLYFYFSWKDPYAKYAIAWNKARFMNGQNEQCRRPCRSSGLAGPGTCCDGVWVPTYEFVNAYEFPEGRTWRYGIRVDGDDVSFWVHTLGTYYSPMDFGSFPFDKQLLMVQFQGDTLTVQNSKVNTFPSATARNIFSPRSTGDEVTGWHINKLDINLVRYNLTEPFQKYGTYSHVNESAALYPDPQNSNVGMPGQFVHPQTKSNIQSEQIIITIEIQRVWLFYFVNLILPVCLNTYLACIVYFLDRGNMETRLTILVTLFLSLTAIQFVINSYLPNSSYVIPIQVHILISYLVLLLWGVESLFVYYIVFCKDHNEKFQARRQAWKREVDRFKSINHHWSTGFKLRKRRTRTQSCTQAREQEKQDQEQGQVQGQVLKEKKPSCDKEDERQECGTSSTTEGDQQNMNFQNIRQNALRSEGEQQDQCRNENYGCHESVIYIQDTGSQRERENSQQRWARLRNLFFKKELSDRQSSRIAPFQLTRQMVSRDQEAAQFVGHKVDKWAFIMVLTIYNLLVVLIYLLAAMSADKIPSDLQSLIVVGKSSVIYDQNYCFLSDDQNLSRRIIQCD